jgi:hypothetical protein
MVNNLQGLGGVMTGLLVLGIIYLTSSRRHVLVLLSDFFARSCKAFVGANSPAVLSCPQVLLGGVGWPVWVLLLVRLVWGQ